MTWFTIQAIIVVVIGLVLAVIAWLSGKHFHPWEDHPPKK